MFKVQQTTVSEMDDKSVRLDIHISEHEEIEDSSEYVVASVVIQRPDSAHRFESMQLRALRQVNDLIDQAADVIEKSFADR